MQSKVKLSKRQMKEDKFTTFMLTSKDKLQDELEEKWQYYVIGLVLVVVVVWAASWHFSRQSGQEVQAAESLAKAMVTYQTGDDQVAILEFTQLVDNYSGTPAAGRAAFLLGNLNLKTRNYPEAIRNYQMYLDEYGDQRLNRAAAYAGIAAVHEDKAEYAEAAASYEQAVAEYPGGPLEADYLLGAFRNYLQVGDIEKADSLRQVLTDEYPGTPWAKQAQRRFAESQIRQ